MKSKEIVLVVLLAMLYFTYTMDYMIILPLGNILMLEWKLTTSEFSVIVSSYYLAVVLSSFGAIFFADKFDRKKLLLVGYLGFLMGTFLSAFTYNVNSLVFARVVTGAFAGIISSQTLSIIGDVIPYERRGRAMGLLLAGFAFSSIIGVPFGLYLANNYNWFYPFLCITFIGLLLFPFLIRYIPNVNEHLEYSTTLKARFQTFIEIFRNKTQLTAVLFSFCMIMGHYLIVPLFNPYIVYNIGLPKTLTPLVYFFGGISALITAQIIGKLADNYGKLKVVVLAGLLSVPIILLVTNLPKISSYLLLIIFSIWFSATASRTVPGQAMITQAVTVQTRGSFMSINACVQALGSGLATLFSGLIAYNDKNLLIHNYNYLGWMSVILILICVSLAFKLDKHLVKNRK